MFLPPPPSSILAFKTKRAEEWRWRPTIYLGGIRGFQGQADLPQETQSSGIIGVCKKEIERKASEPFFAYVALSVKYFLVYFENYCRIDFELFQLACQTCALLWVACIYWIIYANRLIVKQILAPQNLRTTCGDAKKARERPYLPLWRLLFIYW